MITAVERYPVLAQLVMLLIVVAVSVLGGFAVILWNRRKK
jgi:uncharacterized membrane protein